MCALWFDQNSDEKRMTLMISAYIAESLAISPIPEATSQLKSIIDFFHFIFSDMGLKLNFHCCLFPKHCTTDVQLNPSTLNLPLLSLHPAPVLSLPSLLGPWRYPPCV